MLDPGHRSHSFAKSLIKLVLRLASLIRLELQKKDLTCATLSLGDTGLEQGTVWGRLTSPTGSAAGKVNKYSLE